jgi:hypothetical protein
VRTDLTAGVHDRSFLTGDRYVWFEGISRFERVDIGPFASNRRRGFSAFHA